ncbi:sensor histidine kinase [Pedobacter sp. KR3-3]|uniref:Sensor histidine kinase n=1 Tax=Pedobacter albus TaxID=3113905 RepID=A0ABU7I764_9SPHI|nr:sensor histidine kinase [Pedobacter sp. KR3-3]MEE1945293.1 sensor histidine kinase [Pedobacter sp. KR3-3]
MSLFEKILDVQKKHRLLSHILFWLIIMLIAISNSKYRDGNAFSYRFAIIANSLFLGPQILATYFLTYWAVPRFFYKKKYAVTLVGFIFASYIICVLCRFLIIRVAEPLAGTIPKAFETNREILTNLPKLLYIYFFSIFSLAFVFMFIKLLKDQLDIQKRTLTLEKQKTEAELRLLKTQLNPHFLFNTLNNIYSLSLMSSPATSAAIARLSEILDHTLYRCDREFIPLSTEIALLDNYIGLEKLRYDKSLQVRFNKSIDQETNIAPLLMLSIVENAFKHGAGKDTGIPFITIDLEVSKNIFIFKVVNSVSYNHGNQGGANEKIGLKNLKQQLQLIYGSGHQLVIEQTGELFKVILQIDLTMKKTYEEDTLFIGR